MQISMLFPSAANERCDSFSLEYTLVDIGHDGRIFSRESLGAQSRGAAQTSADLHE